MKRSILFYVLCVFTLCTYAQGISVSAPSHVATGENFRLTYSVNAQSVDDFRAANIPSGLEVIAGPYTSYQSSYQMINGHTSRSASVTYTYTLYAEKAGTYTIPGARAKVDGKTISSHSVHIKVSGAAKSGGSSAPKNHEDESYDVNNTGHISAKDLFVKVSANKKRVHEQEPILLTYKVYTLVDLTSLDGKMPDLTGFHTQEIKLPQQKSFHVEKVNGRNYRCVTWSQYVMYPQMTGKLQIPSITFKGVVVARNNAVDPFEAFFNGGSGYVEIKRDIVAPSLNIEVVPLPAKPVNFSGGVGRFNISAQLLGRGSYKEGDPVTLRVVIGGNGNLKLVKQPVVNFPKDFDRYDPKVTDRTRLTANGIEGNMVYDYLVVPRNQGKYTIPSVELNYYDVAADTYKTVRTQPIEINVAKGDGRKSSVSDYSGVESSDIRAIKTGEATSGKGYSFYRSASYWLGLILPFVFFLSVLVYHRNRVRDNADVARMKGKRANKVATKRLKKALQLLNAGRQNLFYDETLRALWGYAGDKLNMPVEQLSRENIAAKLEEREISRDTIDKFIAALDECEFERYAPGDVGGNMMKTYDTAMIAITDIEGDLKTSRGKRSAQTASTLSVIIIGFVLSLCSVEVFAVNKADADSAYTSGNYIQAARIYNELLKVDESATLYYNLGNAYYRLGNIGQSVVAYEKALRLAPQDDDIRANLKFVHSKTIDRVSSGSRMFFVDWYESMLNLCGIDGWAGIGVASFIVMLLLIAVYFLCGRVVLRKVGFYGALLSFVIFIMSNFFAWQQLRAFNAHDRAVVVRPSAQIRKTPSDTSASAFVLHEGTSVVITDSLMKGWLGIRLDDGREGWIKSNQVEVI